MVSSSAHTTTRFGAITLGMGQDIALIIRDRRSTVAVIDPTGDFAHSEGKPPILAVGGNR